MSDAALTIPLRSRVNAAPVPALYRCRVRHSRSEGLRNRFDYGMFCWLVNLDELPVLPRWLRPLARFRSDDHIGHPNRSIRENVGTFLASRDIDLRGGTVLMLTQTRSLGYVFNPLTVHWCYFPSGELAAIVAEVHNTYGQRHCYLIRPNDRGVAEAAKEFYVSPFFPVDGHYRMRFSAPGPRIEIDLTLYRGSGATEPRPALHAALAGERRPATAGELVGCLLRYPPGGFRVAVLIRYQGVKLFLRGLPIRPRPPHPAPPDGEHSSAGEQPDAGRTTH